MKAIQIISLLLTISLIANQDLLGGLSNVTIPNISLSNLNGTVATLMTNVTSAISQLNNTLGGSIPGGVVPSNIDFGKVADVQNLLNNLNSTTFNLENPVLIPELKNLTSTEKCISRLSKLFTFMSMAEQVAFFSAYKTVKSNPTQEDAGRCFAPRILKQTFKKINQGNMMEMGKKMTEDSKKVRNSFSCVANSFKKLKLSANYTEDLESFTKTQGTANQCKSSFIRTLTQTLAGRRRYLLLTEKDSNATAITDSEGKVDGFMWLKSEVENITKSFLSFADCYQALPEALTKTYANLLAKVSEDPQCVSTARVLQTNSTANTTTSGSAPSPSTTPSTPTAANTTTSGSAPAPSTNKPSGNATTSGSAPAPSTNKPSGSQPSPSGSNEKPKKPKSILYTTFTDAALTQLNTLSANFNKKTGDYLTVGKLITGFVNETQLVAQCNIGGLMKSQVSENSDNLNKVFAVESKKLEKNEACASDYLVFVEKAKGGSNGRINCSDADKNCVNATFTAKSSTDNIYMVLVSGCVSGDRLFFGYVEDPQKGKSIEFSSKNVSTCVKGASNKCAKEFANTKKSGQRLLQTDSGCTPKMKATCSDEINKSCSDSNLFGNIAQNQPSASDRSLPDDCLNIDPQNPDYSKCFNWINNNLIAFSIFPKVTKIEDIISLINSSQSTTLRFLQTASGQVKIVDSDASSNDPVAKLPEDQITLTANDVVIDGTTSESIKPTSSVVAEIEVADNTATPTAPSSNSASEFKKIGLGLIAFVFAVIFN